ncbi:MAG: Hint domain-containing protein, partial [Sulfitobacter sp.]
MFGWKNKAGGLYHRTAETSGATDGGLDVQMHGLMAGTRVASNLGWRSIEALTVGDSVLTFDNGMQVVSEIRRMTFWTDAPDTAPAMWPVIVPAGALGNRNELTLLADQGVLVECDAADELYGDPFAVIPAHTLDGIRGITRAAPDAQIELIAIYFEAEQVIYAEGGALIHCPATTLPLDALLSTSTTAYGMLSTRDAVFLAECMVMEDRILAKCSSVERQT